MRLFEQRHISVPTLSTLGAVDVYPDVTAMVDQQRKVAAARMAIMSAISQSDERDVAVWIAALTESLKRVSDWNLELEHGQDRAA